MKETTSRRDNHADKILEMLRQAGRQGCLNRDLWVVCHAVNSRISDLRKRGYRIDGQRIDRSLYRYTLREKLPAAEFMLGTQEAIPF